MGSDDEDKPTWRQRRILKAMRQGQTLAEGTSKYAVAELDEDEEVELRIVEEMEAAGWIYVINVMKGKRTWKLTQDGLRVLERY